jgi:hypothetical protein
MSLQLDHFDNPPSARQQRKREDKNTRPQKDKYPFSLINAFTQFEYLEIFSPEKDK